MSAMISPTISAGRHISRLEVKGLFGHLNYQLSLDALGSGYDDLLIVYGDNGSGKTTILTMIFNLLSRQAGLGYKTSLSRIPFSAFNVEFADGSFVLAERSAGKLVGEYDVTVGKAGSQKKRFRLKVAADGAFKMDENPFTDLFRCLAELEVSLFSYLTTVASGQTYQKRSVTIIGCTGTLTWPEGRAVASLQPRALAFFNGRLTFGRTLRRRNPTILRSVLFWVPW